MSPRHPISGRPPELIGFPWSGATSRPKFVEFDATAFGQRVLAKMGGRTFREVAPDVGIGHATLNRVTRGKVPDVQTYLRLLSWLDGTAPTTSLDVSGVLEDGAKLRKMLIEVDDFINEPPRLYDIEPMEVRDYRHALYRKWEPLCRAIDAALKSPPSPGREG